MGHDLVIRLTQARKAARLTQAQLAERAGLSRMTVQRLEGGNLDPRLSTLQELTRVLGMELHAVHTVHAAQQPMQAEVPPHHSAAAPAMDGLGLPA